MEQGTSRTGGLIGEGVRTMVMKGRKGFVLLCEKCGHEETVFFSDRGAGLFRGAVEMLKPCPICDGRMKRHPNKVIMF